MKQELMIGGYYHIIGGDFWNRALVEFIVGDNTTLDEIVLWTCLLLVITPTTTGKKSLLAWQGGIFAFILNNKIKSTS